MKPHLCTSIGTASISELARLLPRAFREGSDLVEVRLDYLQDFNLELLSSTLKGSLDRCILTFRSKSEGGVSNISEQKRLLLIEDLASCRPAYLDIELETLQSNRNLTSRLLKEASLIVSWHDTAGTPSRTVLRRIARRCFDYGGVTKIVTKAEGMSDNFVVMALYEVLPKGKLIAFCMGEAGLLSRIAAPWLGSPFTYASPDKATTAQGQIPIKVMRKFYDLVKPSA